VAFFFLKLVCCVTWLHSSAVYVKQLIDGIQFLFTGSAWFVKDVVDKFLEHSRNYIGSGIITSDRERRSWGLYFRVRL
jgi:hypothetical protein